MMVQIDINIMIYICFLQLAISVYNKFRIKYFTINYNKLNIKCYNKLRN